LEKLKEEVACDKDGMKRVREKNSWLKMQNSRLKMQLLYDQIRERMVLWGLLLLFAVLIGISFAIEGRK